MSKWFKHLYRIKPTHIIFFFKSDTLLVLLFDLGNNLGNTVKHVYKDHREESGLFNTEVILCNLCIDGNVVCLILATNTEDHRRKMGFFGPKC